MSVVFDPQQNFQSQAALGTELAKIALQHTRKSVELFTLAVDEGLNESTRRLSSLQLFGVPNGPDALAGLADAGAKAVERQVKLNQALWNAGLETLQASSEALRGHTLGAAVQKASKAR